MTDLTPFILPRADVVETCRAHPDHQYQAIVLLTRDLGDDAAVLGRASDQVTGAALAGQIAKELQAACDDGMAGDFQVLKVAAALMPHTLGVTLPDTPLSPWQREFADAYGEADYAWMATLADATDAGDTIFTAVMVELDAKEDCDSGAEAVRRLDVLIEELTKARDAITV
ncbi:hypothetical protein MARCHEWKA_01100 [Brevundimonas phage vB_BpoS-Marchewka]|uniref:Uncharacterized protein n=1 Tax=Brevundimonas phage vB_BpoS-Marchewka TaxID=2948604 RepID=A0A9E7SQT0_9CAUD|nr:hypothetical protein MARCHEWKA_01100 [Brevundimonas phage vB_BpoS-Marchewka]